ncbi:hypothetical protein [Pseudomonas sp. H3_H05]
MGVRMFQPLRLDLGDVLGQSPAELKQTIAGAKVLVIANQDVSVAPYVQLMRRLGAPVHHVLAKYCLEDYREVLTVTNLYRDGQALGVHEGGGVLAHRHVVQIGEHGVHVTAVGTCTGPTR